MIYILCSSETDQFQIAGEIFKMPFSTSELSVTCKNITLEFIVLQDKPVDLLQVLSNLQVDLLQVSSKLTPFCGKVAIHHISRAFISVFQNLGFLPLMIFFSFSLAWDPMGEKISKRYCSHSYDSFSTKLFSKKKPCDSPHKKYLYEFVKF